MNMKDVEKDKIYNMTIDTDQKDDEVLQNLVVLCTKGEYNGEFHFKALNRDVSDLLYISSNVFSIALGSYFDDFAEFEYIGNQTTNPEYFL